MNEDPQRSKVVICGAGIAGISAAYFLAVKQGFKDILLLDEGDPLSLTSDKSTECYRNWWPGPGDAMVALMNRSITLMEEMERQSGYAFKMNQRGYLYVTTDKDNVILLRKAAEEAAELGAGALRIHDFMPSDYEAHMAEGIGTKLAGADLITDQRLIKKHFPYLTAKTKAVLHVRRAGWLSAQQYGMWMLNQAKEAGVRLIRASISNINVMNNQISSIQSKNGTQMACDIFINAAGPFLPEVGKLMGVDIPVVNELHVKSGIEDFEGVIARNAPMIISADEQLLEWTEDERSILKEDDYGARLLKTLPMGAHTRPEGSEQGQNILVLWDIHNEAVEADFPLEIDPISAEIAVRGLMRIVPGMAAYIKKMPRPFIDGGYYTKTKENRPLAGPLSVKGAYVIGAASGYGIMAAAGLAELLAAQIANKKLPEYAHWFSLERYQNSEYQDLLKNWGSSWQL